MLDFKKIRCELGLTRKQIAVYLGVCERSVGRYEDGTRLPYGSTIRLYEMLQKKVLD